MPWYRNITLYNGFCIYVRDLAAKSVARRRPPRRPARVAQFIPHRCRARIEKHALLAAQRVSPVILSHRVLSGTIIGVRKYTRVTVWTTSSVIRTNARLHSAFSRRRFSSIAFRDCYVIIFFQRIESNTRAPSFLWKSYVRGWTNIVML